MTETFTMGHFSRNDHVLDPIDRVDDDSGNCHELNGFGPLGCFTRLQQRGGLLHEVIKHQHEDQKFQTLANVERPIEKQAKQVWLQKVSDELQKVHAYAQKNNPCFRSLQIVFLPVKLVLLLLCFHIDYKQKQEQSQTDQTE